LYWLTHRRKKREGERKKRSRALNKPGDYAKRVPFKTKTKQKKRRKGKRKNPGGK